MPQLLAHDGFWEQQLYTQQLGMINPLICNMNNGVIPNDFEFMLYDRNIEDDVVEVSCKRFWCMVDNGYLSWLCIVPPI